MLTRTSSPAQVLYDETVVLELAELEKRAKAGSAKKFAGSWR